MIITWAWNNGQKMMTITLTQHEAGHLYGDLVPETQLGVDVDKACFKFSTKGTV